MLLLSTRADLKKLETEFLITICRPIGDKWQSNILFLEIFDPCSSIVKMFSIATYPVWACKEIRETFQRNIVIIFLPIDQNKCFRYPTESSH